jgi:dihydrofolate reductase
VRRIRYQVAASLDGYIAGPHGEYDWIVMDPDIDFTAMFQQFDTLLMGRRTFEMMQGQGNGTQEQSVVVVSRTLKQADHPAAKVISSNLEAELEALRTEPGKTKDIWLFGGGELFRSVLEINQVDTVEVAVIPVLLGGGIPLLPTPAAQKTLALASHRVMPKTGIVFLHYDVVRKPEKKKRVRQAVAQ